jgi:hypothetical protein
MSTKSQSDNAKKGVEKRRKKAALLKSVEESISSTRPGPITYSGDETLIDTLCKDADPLMAARLRAYHKTVGDPIDWPGCEKVEKVLGEVIKNQDAQISLDQTRGLLIPRKELKTAAHGIREAWWKEVQQIGNRVLLQISDLSNEDRARVKNAIEKEVGTCAERAKSRALEFLP